MDEKEVIRDLPKGLIGWYDFDEGSNVLYVKSGIKEDESFIEILKEKNLQLHILDEEEIFACEDMDLRYTYIVMIGALERSDNPMKFLCRVSKMLFPEGKLLIGAGNRLAIRYFCGDKDLFTGRVFDGVENYRKVSQRRRSQLKGRLYSKDELRKMLSDAGFKNNKFYSVMPDLMRPQVMLSETYTPNEVLDIRVFPQYNSPSTVFLEEEKLYDDLLKNQMYHSMANGFLVECCVSGKLSDADQITISGDRGREEILATVLCEGKTVCKKALYPEGKDKVYRLLENTEYLSEHKVNVVGGKLDGDAFVMPYVKGQIATQYFRDILREDADVFLKELSRFREIVMKSSEIVPYEEVDWQRFDPNWEKRKKDDPNIDKWKNLAFGSEEDRMNIGPVLERGYIDLVSLNCFFSEGDFWFFDQEFYLEKCPANAVFIRTVDLIYNDYWDLEERLPKEDVLRYFNLLEHQDLWRSYASKFLQKLRCEKELKAYHKLCRRENNIVGSNRHRMDYTQEEYEKLFTNIFKNIDGKKIYLFGSGNYSEQFLKQFGSYYEVAGILDNNEAKWGTTLSGIEIMSPKKLLEVDVPYRVFICIKFFEDVLEQLKAMGIRELAIFDPYLDYERPLRYMNKSKQEEPKKYHVGYIAGVFDLYHIGHLNMFKRAKELCDYLIVGVVSDEQVINDKKTSPYIPFEERLEIVQTCEYVDEAVGIPLEAPGTEAAYRMYRFDVQFSGSDYENDPEWIAKRTYLRQHGSDLVFFPYTQSTSSTKLKDKISSKK